MVIMAIGAHPDDIELGCAGTLINHTKKGDKVILVDLTQGELGSRGTIETRYSEAKNAAAIIKATARENLKFRDGFFQNDEQHQLELIKIIRKYKPNVVIGNAYYDRHPDHGRASQLIEDACFLSGLSKIETELEGIAQESWRPARVFHYIQDRHIEPDFIVDISDSMEEKMDAVMAYHTQFVSDNEGPKTYINQPGFIESIKNRASYFGHFIGAEYGEGFLCKAKLGIKDLSYFAYQDFS